EKEAWSLRISKACLPSSWTSWRCGSPVWTESSQPLGTVSRVVLKSTNTVPCPQATLAPLPQIPHSITPRYHILRQRIGLFLPVESKSGALYAFPGGSRTIRGVTVAKGAQASSLYSLTPYPLGGPGTVLMAALDGDMTRHDMVGRDVLQRRCDLLAQRAELTRAARHERAAPGRINVARHRAFQHAWRALPLGGHTGHGREEGFSVRMIGWSKDLIHGAAFHDMPQVHDDNLVSEIAHDPEVVTDKQQCGAVRALHLQEQLDDCRLH